MTVGIRRYVVHCGRGGELKDGGLYLYINIHTSVYYPVIYVEIDRSRDVFFGSRDEAVSKSKGQQRDRNVT